MSGKRRWSAEEKLKIVIEGLNPACSVADLCRRERISAAQFYQWKNQLLGSASQIFDRKLGRPSLAEEKAATKERRYEQVIAEITSENLELKKGLLG